MTHETQVDPAEHLAARLAETAESLARTGTLDPRQIATALVSTGITVARTAFGPVATSVWLREVAAEIAANDAERVN